MEVDVAPSLLLEAKLFQINEQSCSFGQDTEGGTTMFNNVNRDELWQSTSLPHS